MDEFAMGSSTENSAFGPVLNPVDETRVPGGSSGGSCVAVASGTAHVALGTDTGGSIRQPAAFCGIVGLKPTYGRVSRYGLVALSSSFDQIGPFAVSVSDAARVLRVIAGHDPMRQHLGECPCPRLPRGAHRRCPRTSHRACRARRSAKGCSPKCASQWSNGPWMRSSAEERASRRSSLPHSQYTISAYYILMTAEASSNLARYDGARYGRRTAGSATSSTCTRARGARASALKQSGASCSGPMSSPRATTTRTTARPSGSGG